VKGVPALSAGVADVLQIVRYARTTSGYGSRHFFFRPASGSISEEGC